MGEQLRQRLTTWVGNLLILGGVLLIVATMGLYGYSQYEQQKYTREAAQIVPVFSATPAATTTPTAVAAPSSDFASERDALRQQSLVDRHPVVPPVLPSPTPRPTAVPIYPAERIVAPTIALDAKVVEAPIVDGEWTVPKFVAGHLQGTANPLQGSNVVLAGHIESISSGNVFANIGNLKPGQPIQLYTRAAIVRYVVSKVEVVKNNDLSVVQPTPRDELTLITCTGTWLPLQRDFNQRLVVVARRAG